jgi:hypothetical protein
MGAYMTIGMSSDTVIRRAGPAGFPGIAGRRRIAYQTELCVYHMAREQFAEDAEADVDDLVEAIHDLIYADVTLGGICYEAGEMPTGIVTNIEPSEMHEQRTETFIKMNFDTMVEIVA